LTQTLPLASAGLYLNFFQRRVDKGFRAPVPNDSVLFPVAPLLCATRRPLLSQLTSHCPSWRPSSRPSSAARPRTG
jgi:hypothetical protein